MSYKIETKFPVAFESLDHLHPFGTVRDNHSNSVFIDSLINLMNGSNDVFSSNKIDVFIP